MPHCDQSPARTERRWALRPLPRRATISILLLTWVASWLWSMLSFYHVYGPWGLDGDEKVPIGSWFGDWVVYPVMFFPIALPGIDPSGYDCDVVLASRRRDVATCARCIGRVLAGVH